MADAKKCDRCGVFYEYYPIKVGEDFNGVTTTHTHKDRNRYSVDHLDLCQNCSTSLKKWLKDKTASVVIMKSTPMGNTSEIV